MDDIQPTMQKTVAWLQSLGFETTDSGDGVTNVEAGMECALDFPHVFMRVDPDKMRARADMLWSIFQARGQAHLDDIRVEASYSPCDGIAVVALIGVTDEVLAHLSS